MNEAELRKATPIYTGFIKYFPFAIEAVARLSKIANEQHHPGTEVHWDMEKSKDEQDAMLRHTVDEAKHEKGFLPETDTDGVLHLTKVAWRAMAKLERKLESLQLKK